MGFFEKMINNKINRITGTELLKYANEYNISISLEEGEQIARVLRGKNFNIFDDQDRMTILKEISKITGADKAREINKIFLKFSRS